MDIKTEKKIISEYKKGKSSLEIVKIVGLSKPTILKVLNKHNLVRKRDRCSTLDIKKDGEKYYVTRKCPNCNKNIKTTSKDKVIACRNHFRKINGTSLCKPCSLKLQVGKMNPFYGKTHTKETVELISKKISENPPKQSSVSNKEKKLLTEVKKLKYTPIGSYSVGRYVCDIYIESLNLIIEFNGDYWHCNPNKYDKGYLHPHKKKTAKEIWDEDNLRVDNIKKYGYNLEVIWECDLDKPNNLKTILKKYERKN
jgi:G:T-mismatch repair DNA endonuclease (very short patch repair protein)